MTKVAVFGAGSWGTAFSLVLADAGHDVTIWGRRDRSLRRHQRRDHENPDYLPGVRLPATISATADPAEAAAGADARRPGASPRRRCGATSRTGRGVIPGDAVMVSLMKGVELGTLKRMSEVIAEVTGAGAERIAVLSGPNLAREIANREPAASVVACAEEPVAARLRELHARTQVPALLQRRRRRLRARRRLQERHRARGGHGGGAGLRRQHHRLADHPRSGGDGPARRSSSGRTRSP